MQVPFPSPSRIPSASFAEAKNFVRRSGSADPDRLTHVTSPRRGVNHSSIAVSLQRVVVAWGTLFQAFQRVVVA